MTMSVFSRSTAILIPVLLLCGVTGALSAPPQGVVPPERALAILQNGNARFIKGQTNITEILSVRKAGVRGQAPHAIILSCSDSRVPPELVFDENLGQLFVIRTAGNIHDRIALGSAEYGAAVLGARLMVVLGHESCGAVEAAMDGKPVPGHIGAVVEKIAPAAAKIRGKGLTGRAATDAAVEENVRLQIKELLAESTILRDLVEQKKLRVVGAIYDLETGSVRWLK